jgi:hypothetical protein
MASPRGHGESRAADPIDEDLDLRYALVRRLQRRNRLAGLALWAVTVGGIYALSHHLAHRLADEDGRIQIADGPLGAMYVAAVALLTVAAIVVQVSRRRNRADAVAADASSQSGDPDTIPLWMEMLSGEDARVIGLARQGLMRALPNVRSHHSTLFREADRSYLRAQLRAPLENALEKDIFFPRRPLPDCTVEPRIAFRVSIIRALAEIGDRDSWPILRELAYRSQVTNREMRIRAAAREWLPILRDRLEVGEASRKLLRSCGVEENQLLRAGPPLGAAQEEHLLRGSASEAVNGRD